jgi:hypothetical protein
MAMPAGAVVRPSDRGNQEVPLIIRSDGAPSRAGSTHSGLPARSPHGRRLARAFGSDIALRPNGAAYAASCASMVTVGHRKRAKDRRALLEQVSDLYWVHRDSWTPTSDLAHDLGITEETASGWLRRPVDSES